ncbi:MAG: N-formylglutamate amidohydrolase [Myxococcales bacterium]|nr:N-formylglutamate amidohydrolase [Myxococcales bacterium]
MPTRWRSLFEDRRAVLTTHRALDLGALDLARYLSRSTKAPLIAATATRLLVDTNRPLGHPRLFSEFSRNLPPEERTLLVERWHQTHWDRVTETLERSLARHQRVIHLGIHSFTPVLHGIPRRADASLLYDPQRPLEREFALRFQRALARVAPHLHFRRNYPYRGRDAGLTTSLRRQFAPRRYLGVELEINQSILTKKGAIAAIGPVVAEALRSAGARP